MSNFEIKDKDICFTDSALVHTIIKDKKYFWSLKIKDYAGSVSKVSDSINIIMRESIFNAKGNKIWNKWCIIYVYSPNLIEIY